MEYKPDPNDFSWYPGVNEEIYEYLEQQRQARYADFLSTVGLPITDFREVHALMNDIVLPYLDVGKELPTSPMIGEPDIDPRERIFHWGTAAQIGTDGVGGLFEPSSTMGLFDVGPDGELIPQHTELPVETETSLAIADLDALRPTPPPGLAIFGKARFGEARFGV